MVKRSVLSTFEKMLMPLSADGKNYLATGYFHRGYEVPMAAVAKLSDFDRMLVGNGVEGTTLYGVHKPTTVFVVESDGKSEKMRLILEETFTSATAQKICEAYEGLKKEISSLDSLASWGEAALIEASGPAAPLVACHAGTLCALLGVFPNAQTGFEKAMDVLYQGSCYEKLMSVVSQYG